MLVLLISGLAAAAGFLLLGPAAGIPGPAAQAFAEAFATGALLTMLTDAMLPEAYQEERNYTGALVVLGCAGSIALAAI